MLTKVILDGPMGKAFGRNWELSVTSAHEALRMIDANKPGVFKWIRKNLPKYENYRITCEYADGRVEELDSEDYRFERRPSVIRFTPIIAGASAGAKIVAGVVIMIVGALMENPAIIKFGAMLALGGMVQALTAPSTKKDTDKSENTSYYFNGAVNTTEQGVPVQLIYGRMLCGSHVLSSRLTIDQTGS